MYACMHFVDGDVGVFSSISSSSFLIVSSDLSFNGQLTGPLHSEIGQWKKLGYMCVFQPPSALPPLLNHDHSFIRLNNDCCVRDNRYIYEVGKLGSLPSEMGEMTSLVDMYVEHNSSTVLLLKGCPIVRIMMLIEYCVVTAKSSSSQRRVRCWFDGYNPRYVRRAAESRENVCEERRNLICWQHLSCTVLHCQSVCDLTRFCFWFTIFYYS
jgi:hypothetical protein